MTDGNVKKKISDDFAVLISGKLRDVPKVKAHHLLLYGSIKAFARQTGYCWASQARLQEDLNATPKQIKSWLRFLEDVGAIKRLIVGDASKDCRFERRIYPLF